MLTAFASHTVLPITGVTVGPYEPSAPITSTVPIRLVATAFIPWTAGTTSIVYVRASNVRRPPRTVSTHPRKWITSIPAAVVIPRYAVRPSVDQVISPPALGDTA